MVVTFFMYLLFWVPHPGRPIPVFTDWFSHIQTAGTGRQGMILLGLCRHFSIRLASFQMADFKFQSIP